MSDHPFTYDRWATPDDPEFGVVRFEDLRKIERACLGIWAAARSVGNSANEPGATGAGPLDAWVVSNLMGGVESTCDQIADLVARKMSEPPLDPFLAKAAISAHKDSRVGSTVSKSATTRRGTDRASGSSAPTDLTAAITPSVVTIDIRLENVGGMF